jgi:hypothetical protein
MIRFLIYLLAEQLFNIVAMLLAPVLPAFASMQDGWSDNSHCRAVEPRLPRWLSWFMTLDNSLWGDAGWQTIHCPAYKSYFGMVKWLWRNHGYGFSWTVLAAPVGDVAGATAEGDLNIDSNNGKFGSFKIVLGPYWQRKWVKRIGGTGYLVSLNVGWLLDTYIKNPATIIDQPKAPFICSPRLRRAING